MTVAKPRIQFIDLAKGVCITLVILFHCGVVKPDAPLLANLRMPLYFFLSGMFFKTYGGLGGFVLRKVNKIVVPFVFFVLVGDALKVMMHALNVHAETGELSLDLSRIALLHGTITNFPMWFLQALFIDNVLFCCLSMRIKNHLTLAVSVAAFSLVGVAMSVEGCYNYGFVGSALTGLPFFYMGYEARRLPILYPGHADRWALPVGLLGLLAAMLVWQLSNGARIHFSHNQIKGLVPAAYVTSVLAVGGALMLCKAVRQLPVLSYVGRYSIVALGVHMPLLWTLQRWLDPTMDVDQRHLIQGAVVLAATIVLIPLLVRGVPYLTAQTDLIGAQGALTKVWQRVAEKLTLQHKVVS